MEKHTKWIATIPLKLQLSYRQHFCLSPLETGINKTEHTLLSKYINIPPHPRPQPLFEMQVASTIWSSSIPLHISHPSSPVPYIIHAPRVSYLALLLPRLSTFFPPATTFHYEDILLKNLPIGLLYDLYQPELPWRLTLGDGVLYDIHDTFINSVKEVRKLSAT